MPVLDVILNCACLLLWLNWRSQSLAGVPRASGIALVGTLRRVDRSSAEHWVSPALLVTLLIGRAFLYWHIGATAHWTPRISLAAVVLHFRADYFTRMLVFSWLGFLRILGGFYFSLLLLAALNRAGTAGPWNVLIRAHLGFLGRVPVWLGVLLPFLFTFLFWLITGPLLAAMKVHLPVTSFYQLCAQASVVGLEGWLVWPYVIAAVLILNIVSSYVYLGNAPLWNFMNSTAQQLLRPLRFLPLRMGKVDLAPMPALAFLVAIIVFAPAGLTALYKALAT